VLNFNNMNPCENMYSSLLALWYSLRAH